MTYQIERDVPIPKPRAAKFPPCPFPFAEMKVGDSFTILPNGKTPYRNQIDASNALRDLRKRAPKLINGYAITTRQTWDGSVRVWRTK